MRSPPTSTRSGREDEGADGATGSARFTTAAATVVELSAVALAAADVSDALGAQPATASMASTIRNTWDM